MAEHSLSDSLDGDGKLRLKAFMDAAEVELQKLDDIREGLSDMCKKVAEELEIKPAKLMKAAKVKYKDKRDEERETADLIDEIIEITR